MKKTVGQVASILLNIEVTLLVIILIVMVGVPFFGITPYGVLSGSMSPAIQKGDLVLIDTNEKDSITEGDVIAFELASGDICTHRVNEISETGEITTKGDANSNVDAAKVTKDHVIGKEIMVIPKLGDFYGMMSANRFIFLAFILSITCLLLLLTKLKGDKNVSRTSDGS